MAGSETRGPRLLLSPDPVVPLVSEKSITSVSKEAFLGSPDFNHRVWRRGKHRMLELEKNLASVWFQATIPFLSWCPRYATPELGLCPPCPSPSPALS